MAEVSGSGLAVGLEDIRVTATPTSFIELTGTEPADPGFDRLDLRLYGLSLTGITGSEAWSGSCGSGPLGLGCPLGDSVALLAAHDNPFLFRAFPRAGFAPGGDSETLDVLELLWPTSHDPYRLAFWGEMRLDGGDNPGPGTEVFQFQMIANNLDQSGSRLYLIPERDAGAFGPGMVVDLHLAGDLRFSVNQSATSPDSFAQVPQFTSREGVYLADFRAHLPVGQIHYQTLFIEGVEQQDGNIRMGLSRLPQQQAVFNHFYGRTLNDDPSGGYDRSVNAASDSWADTHGFIRWGNWRGGDVIPGYHPDNDPATPRANAPAEFPGTAMPDRTSASRNPPVSTTQGMFFAATEGNTFMPEARGNYFDAGPGGTPQMIQGQHIVPLDTVNLGDGRIEGLLVQSLTVRTLGAAQ